MEATNHSDNEIAFVKKKLDRVKEELRKTKEELDKKNKIILTLIRKLKSSGTPAEEIAVLTGLTFAQIKAL